MPKRTVTVTGLRELERNLAKLTKAAAKGATRRTLRLAAVPMHDAAVAKAPVDTGNLKLSISVSPKKPKHYEAGKIAYYETMQAMGGRQAAVAAMRLARKKSPATFSEIFIGPTDRSFYSSFVEYGTEHSAPEPFMRPAWDETQDEALQIIANELGNEIDKAVARMTKKAARAGK